jgi:hypothetical protein
MDFTSLFAIRYSALVMSGAESFVIYFPIPYFIFLISYF